jgi:cytochrome c peroxidase
MKRTIGMFTAVALLGAGLLAAGYWLGRPRTAVSAEVSVAPTPAAPEPDFIAGEPIQPIPRSSNLDPRRVALGRRLFVDPRLSADNSISCNSCHNLQAGGADVLAHSRGINGAVGDINTPTVLNAVLNYKQFWDGRADTLEQQIDGPTHNPKEMGSSWSQIIGKLQADAGYVRDFAAIYPKGIDADSIKDALATFERSLLTPNSRFDRYLRGEREALSANEIKGYQLFKDLGCISCHQGMNAGGNMFQPFGVMANYFAERGNVTKADLGRFNVTGQPEDRHKFKVPGLRNVELTAPYFHDGSAATLEDAVRMMARYQLGQPIKAEQVDAIVAFLKTLTGEGPEA